MKAAMQSGAIEAGQEKRLIGAILEWPELLSRVDEALFEMQFSSPQAMQMQRALLSYWRATKTVEKSALNTHIASEGLETLHREFARDRLLIRAAMGGTDAELDIRAALWMKEADSLNGQDQTGDGSDEARTLMADAIRNDNSDALKRRMRASRGDRE